MWGGGGGIRYAHLPSSLGEGGGGVLSKFRIGQSELCPSQRCSTTTQHLLQACPLHHNLTCYLWPVRSGTASQASLLAELSELDLSSQVIDKKEEIYSTELTSNTCSQSFNTDNDDNNPGPPATETGQQVGNSVQQS